MVWLIKFQQSIPLNPAIYGLDFWWTGIGILEDLDGLILLDLDGGILVDWCFVDFDGFLSGMIMILIGILVDLYGILLDLDGILLDWCLVDLYGGILLDF